MYAKNRIKFDVYTYQNIAKMYLELRELDNVFDIMNKCREAKVKPKKILLNIVLEAALRKQDTDQVY